MLKQLLTGSSLLALLLAGGLSAQARTKELMLQSQVQQAPTTSPAPDGTTTSETCESIGNAHPCKNLLQSLRVTL